MSNLIRLSLSIAIIFFSIAAGWLCKQAIHAGFFHIPEESLELWRKRAQTVAIFFLLPLAAMLSLWALPKPDAELLLLPFLGVLTYTAGGALALVFSRLLALSRRQTGAYYCCGAFNNIGAIGGLVCLIFLGENTIALTALFRLLEEIYYFGLSFPIARYFATDKFQREKSTGNNYKLMLFLIVCALGTGILLNIQHVPRPPIFGYLASFFMLSATIIFLFTIGLSLRIRSVSSYLIPALGICLIKFCLLPPIIIAAAYCCGLASFDNGLAIKVCAVLSAMPVAMTALAPATIFNLDLDLANSCWLVSTFSLLAVLPILFYVLPHI